MQSPFGAKALQTDKETGLAEPLVLQENHFISIMYDIYLLLKHRLSECI